VRKILLLANPLFESRHGKYIPDIVRVFSQAGVDIEVLETGPNRAAGGMARQAVEQGVDAIIVGGGDGTVFDVLQGIVGSDVPLGILPFGTGNVLAQNLKIPKHPVAAARWLLAAQPKRVPLGKITCCVTGGRQAWFFAMAAGMGLHAAMMELAQRSNKDRVGKMAYFAAGLKVLSSYPVQSFDMVITTVDGKMMRRQVSEMVAVRVAELNAWRPGGDLSSSFLRLASITGARRWDLAQASFQALVLGAGRRNGHAVSAGAAHYEDVLRVECKPISSTHYKVPISVEADGEVLGASCATIEMAGVSVRLLSNADAANC
jgi:diacylglycerol kinase family enzyme